MFLLKVFSNLMLGIVPSAICIIMQCFYNNLYNPHLRSIHTSVFCIIRRSVQVVASWAVKEMIAKLRSAKSEKFTKLNLEFL